MLRRESEPGSKGRKRRPSVRIIGLLIGSLATTAVLAWQASHAFEAHRAAATSVLHDYAMLAANEFVRRATARLGYDGYYALVTALSRELQKDADLDRAVRTLDEEADERFRPALSLARRYFVTPARDGDGGIHFVGGDPETATLLGWIEGAAAETGDETRPYFVAHGLVSEEPVSVVFGELPSSAGTRHAGFQVDLEALRPFLASAFDASSLIPPSLGSGNVSNDVLFLSVVDQGGVERFRSPGTPHPEFRVEAPFGDAYGGILEGSVVRLSLDPEAASALVTGGLPPSRLPIYLGLLLLTAALMATAVREVRRERRLQSLRSELVASVSHDLRTPLTQIRLFAETLLLGRVRSPEEGKHSLEIINREARHLSHLVENLLQFSRVETGRLRLSPLPGPLEPALRETLEIFQPMLSVSAARLTTRIEPDVRAAFDADALGQVLLNLLDNAVKYGPRDQEIVVGIESRNGSARVFVQDQGPGIPREERSRIFERFHRLDRDRSSSVAGTGIGLAIVKELVTLQRGRVLVEDGEDGGARFVVELEAAPPTPTPTPTPTPSESAP